MIGAQVRLGQLLDPEHRVAVPVVQPVPEQSYISVGGREANGDADLALITSGPKGRARIRATADLARGQWSLRDLELHAIEH